MRPPRSEGWLSRFLPTKAPPRCCRLECEVAEAWAGEQLSWARRDEAGAETLLTEGARLLTSEAGVSVEAVPGSATLTVARVWLQQEGEYRCYRGNIAHNNYIQHTLEISGGSSGTLHSYIATSRSVPDIQNISDSLLCPRERDSEGS